MRMQAVSQAIMLEMLCEKWNGLHGGIWGDGIFKDVGI